MIDGSPTGEFIKINGDEFHTEIELEETKHSAFVFSAGYKGGDEGQISMWAATCVNCD